MTNECRSPNDETKHEPPIAIRASSFGFPSSFVIRASSLPSYLPILHELIRDFFQETRRPLENIAEAAAQSHVWIGEIELIARAGDGDVKQPPFFLNCVACFKGACAWEHSVGQPNHEHGVIFEAFRLVH